MGAKEKLSRRFGNECVVSDVVSEHACKGLSSSYVVTHV